MRKEAVQATVYVELFSQALRVLIPFMEQVGIGWKEIDQYDNFDHIADALFAELVLHPLTNDVYGYDRSFKYDFAPYSASWGEIVVNDRRNSKKSGRFVRLSENELPFDTAVYISDQNMVSIPLSDAFFSLVCEVD